MFSLEGKNAFITGGTSGIGLATAKRLSQAGARVAILGRRDGTALAAEMGGLFVQADVTQEDELRKAFQRAERELGKLDIVMNNAGIENTGPSIDQADAEKFQRVLETNVKAVYNGLRYGPRHMNDGGSIINTASVAGVLGLPGSAQYGATKAAVINLTRQAAMELVPRKIRVNAICPGSVWTGMLPRDHPGVPVIEKLCPLGRIGEPEEIAAACHFLGAPDCSYITGQAICIDGGLVAGFAMHTIGALIS